MTSYTPAARSHWQTLVANVVDTVTFPSDLNTVTVINRDSYATIWYTSDGSTPVAAAPATATSAAVTGVGTPVAPGVSSTAPAGNNVIKMVSTGNALYALSAVGGASTKATYNSSGAVIPPGTLDRFKALRAQCKAGTLLGEIPVYGDSTTWGQTSGGNASTGVGNYPITEGLRAQAIASGYPDGGHGILGNPTAASMTGADNLALQVSTVGTWAGGFYSPIRQYGFACTSNTTGDQLVVQVKVPAGGGKVRINFTTNTPASGSAWSYQVDSGTVNNVAAQTATRKTKTYTVTGLAAGTHTITVTLTSTGTAGTGNEYTFEVLGNAGIVFHNYGISGSKAAGRFDIAGGFAQEAFGLGYYEDAAWTTATTPYLASTTVRSGTPRVPILGIHSLAINDQQNSSANFASTSAANDAMALVKTSIGSFAELCRFAQVDCLVLIPHMLYAFNPQWSGLFRAAIREAAAGFNLPTYDMQVPLGGKENLAAWGGGVHLNQAGYDAQAAGLWSAVLNAA